MDIRRILCPIDFSESSHPANDYASLLAKSSGARIIYLHVTQPDVPYSSHVQIDMKKEEARDRERLEEIKPTVEGVPASYAVEFGAPTARIVEFASENDIDLIVMSTHGRTGMNRVLMGSVAEVVVRRAICPVLAVKSPVDIPQIT